ncbi:hypothetical protein EZ428_18520 [Pedobacter frigiditerrae]|uniref:Uncharacterized protein n=1 Tax=Pedobacter frigiditerrae TaxID=2530452 RepID=A0A4R0MQT3_9SPHI|nr:hypothetical protein [Pedobacter frigiditerrae]TCC88632.1 hypothetical protein EZ428_18520 [Pedobacter frigiditerrae]
MAISLQTVGITAKDLAKSSLYRNLALAIPEGQDNEHHVDFTSKDAYSIGFIPENAMLHTNPNWQPPKGENRISMQFARKTPSEVDETHKKLIESETPIFKGPWDSFLVTTFCAGN